MSSTQELAALFAERGDALLRSAVLLAGGRQAGEDLLQEALERVMRHRGKLIENSEAYVRRVMYNLATDRWRRRGRTPQVVGMLGDYPVETDQSEVVEWRLVLLDALAQLPPRQRTAVVLRYYEHLDQAETAQAMGCGVGTVKSATSKGLARIREVLGPHVFEHEPH